MQRLASEVWSAPLRAQETACLAGVSAQIGSASTTEVQRRLRSVTAATIVPFAAAPSLAHASTHACRCITRHWARAHAPVHGWGVLRRARAI
jgi:hypothetical protein